ncbi:MAG: hypothetical protein ACO39F_05485 [Candidatus Nanopelagicaceae bacterium]
MQEIIVIFIIMAAIAISYLWIYPTYVGNNVKRMQGYDLIISLVVIGIVAALYMGDDLEFTFFFFETNWFVFTLLIYLFEFPLMFWYLKARGITKEYFTSSFGVGGAGSANIWGNASVKSVAKQLDDEKWNGLRTREAKLFLLIGSNVYMFAASIFLLLVGDSPWATFSLIHILLIGVFWFLLRTSSRLVAEAPDAALDERMIQLRNWAYLWSYRWLSFMTTIALITVMIFVIVNDMAPESDGFNYRIEFSWPQMQAIWWLFLGYSLMLPSMSYLGLELRQKKAR